MALRKMHKNPCDFQKIWIRLRGGGSGASIRPSSEYTYATRLDEVGSFLHVKHYKMIFQAPEDMIFFLDGDGIVCFFLRKARKPVYTILVYQYCPKSGFQ